jgi:ParB family transcriptional regulator, chromosome partitioning protein
MVKFDALREFDVSALMTGATGKALALPVNKIEFDPDNIRTKHSLDPAQLEELAATIKSQGLIQPISVRNNPKRQGFYVVNAGERRLRAVRLLGHVTIDSYIQDDFDPYLQAVENLQREELHPLDIARFVAAREAAGDSRTTIAKRLGKPKSFISEVAHLASAPESIIKAFEDERIDTRTAYLLTRHYQRSPQVVQAWLAGDAPLTRLEVSAALAAPKESRQTAATERKPSGRGSKRQGNGWNALAITVGGRHGILNLAPGTVPNQATVRFADGSQESVALGQITLKHWIAA